MSYEERVIEDDENAVKSGGEKRGRKGRGREERGGRGKEGEGEGKGERGKEGEGKGGERGMGREGKEERGKGGEGERGWGKEGNPSSKAYPSTELLPISESSITFTALTTQLATVQKVVRYMCLHMSKTNDIIMTSSYQC